MDVDKPASSEEFNFLHYSFGYWDFPKKADVKITDVKYVFWAVRTRGNNQEMLQIR